MYVDELTVAGVPLLAYHTGCSTGEAAKNGCIIFHHGLGADKETGAKECSSLASLGFLVLAADNVGHGARRYPDFETRLGRNDEGWNERFLEAVEETAREVPRLTGLLYDRYGATRFGLCGISMGGYICYRAAVLDERVSVLTPILGSPVWDEGDRPSRSPHLFAASFWPRWILSQNAGRDESVPPGDARRFHENLADFYSEGPERQRYVEYPDSGHFMNERDWNSLWKRVLEWFDLHLREDGNP